MAEAPSEAAKEQAAVIPGMFHTSDAVPMETTDIDRLLHSGLGSDMPP